MHEYEEVSFPALALSLLLPTMVQTFVSDGLPDPRNIISESQNDSLAMYTLLMTCHVGCRLFKTQDTILP